ncbi:MAG: futalosine hydrolase [Desulfovibrio desulfuricans]|nr:futalosine hydrolase [Desulfovibrio desulfuricans]
MSLLICAATGPELGGLLPDFAPPSASGGHGGAHGAERYTADATAWPEMRLWPVQLKKSAALCCLTGIGPVNAALAMGHALSRAEAEGSPISAVLNVGLAGAFDLASHPLLSHCLVQEEIWPEYGLHDGQTVIAGAFGFPQWQPPQGEAVRDRLPLCGVEALSPFGGRCDDGTLAPCRSLTVAGVSASFARAADLRSRYQADLENMEGFAVAYACARQGIACVEVRSVSNKVGPRAREEKDFPGALRALAQVLPALNLI